MTCAIYALALAAWTALGGAPPVKPQTCNGGLMDNA